MIRVVVHDGGLVLDGIHKAPWTYRGKLYEGDAGLKAFSRARRSSFGYLSEQDPLQLADVVAPFDQVSIRYHDPYPAVEIRVTSYGVIPLLSLGDDYFVEGHSEKRRRKVANFHERVGAALIPRLPAERVDLGWFGVAHVPFEPVTHWPTNEAAKGDGAYRTRGRTEHVRAERRERRRFSDYFVEWSTEISTNPQYGAYADLLLTDDHVYVRRGRRKKRIPRSALRRVLDFDSFYAFTYGRFSRLHVRKRQGCEVQAGLLEDARRLDIAVKPVLVPANHP